MKEIYFGKEELPHRDLSGIKDLISYSSQGSISTTYQLLLMLKFFHLCLQTYLFCYGTVYYLFYWQETLKHLTLDHLPFSVLELEAEAPGKRHFDLMPVKYRLSRFWKIRVMWNMSFRSSRLLQIRLVLRLYLNLTFLFWISLLWRMGLLILSKFHIYELKSEAIHFRVKN